MKPRTPTKTTRTAPAVRGVSWMSLVAATTLGVGGVDQLRAHIRAGEQLAGDGELRLIVQSYPVETLGGDRLPTEYAQPLASTQRAITKEELERGVDVNFLQLSAGDAPNAVVVAWVERGAPTLELDALEARPKDGVYYGVAHGRRGEIVLRLSGSAAPVA